MSFQRALRGAGQSHEGRGGSALSPTPGHGEDSVGRKEQTPRADVPAHGRCLCPAFVCRDEGRLLLPPPRLPVAARTCGGHGVPSSGGLIGPCPAASPRGRSVPLLAASCPAALCGPSFSVSSRRCLLLTRPSGTALSRSPRAMFRTHCALGPRRAVCFEFELVCPACRP